MTPKGFTRRSKGFLVSRTAGPPVQPAERFAWLRDPRGRRSGLAEAERALINGWGLDDASRAELAAGLGELLASDDLPERERVRAARVIGMLETAGQGVPGPL